jgi:hypothetical protein
MDEWIKPASYNRTVPYVYKSEVFHKNDHHLLILHDLIACKN